MIKKLFLIACFGAFFSTYTMAQDVDQRLLVKYSQAELVDMKKNSNEKYKLLVYSLDNAMYITNYSDEKGENDGVIEMPEKGKNYLELGFELNEKENQFYKIGDTGKGLMILSKLRLEYQMKQASNKK